MRLGIVHTAVGETGLDASFQRAAEIGFEGIEVHYTDADEVRALRRAGHAGELRKLRQKHGLDVAGLTLGALCRKPTLIGRPQEAAKARDLIGTALSVASEAGVRVVVVPFFGKNAIELEEELNRAAEALLALVEQAEQAGVVMAVESTLNFSQMQFLLSYLGTGNVGICLDTGDATARKLDVATGIRELGTGAIVEVHLKDVRTVEGAPPDFVPGMGDGYVDFRAVAHALRAVGYDGWAVLETPPGDDPLGNAQANLTYARAIFGAAGGAEGTQR